MSEKINLPNFFSLLRILLSPLMIYFSIIGHRPLFVLGIALIVATDLFDGQLARKRGPTKFGARLDGFADVVAIFSVLIGLILLEPGLLLKYWYVPLIILSLYIITQLMKRARYKRFIISHTMSIKIANIAGFMAVVYTLLFEFSIILFSVWALLMLLHFIEEFLFVILKRENNEKVTSIFSAKKKY